MSDCDLWFVWAGRGRMWLDESEIVLRPGVCLWMRPGRRYESEQDLEDRLGVTYVHFDVLDDHDRPIRRHDDLPAEIHELPDVPYADAVARRVRTLMRDGGESGQAAASTLFAGLLMDIEAGPVPAPGPAPGTPMRHHRIVSEAASRISESPHDVPPVIELAREAGYSPDHFARVFRTVTGRSPQQYVIDARVQRAMQLLIESDLSIGEIAAALGYCDVYFFCRQFRHKTGRTPGRYRDSATDARATDAATM